MFNQRDLFIEQNQSTSYHENKELNLHKEMREKLFILQKVKYLKKVHIGFKHRLDKKFCYKVLSDSDYQGVRAPGYSSVLPFY